MRSAGVSSVRSSPERSRCSPHDRFIAGGDVTGAGDDQVSPATTNTVMSASRQRRRRAGFRRDHPDSDKPGYAGERARSSFTVWNAVSSLSATAIAANASVTEATIR
jgi:hypothetical protein